MEQAVKANGQCSAEPIPLPSADWRQLSDALNEWHEVAPGQYAKKDKPKPVEFDPISKPAYYSQGDIEPCQFIEDQRLGFHEGSAIQYNTRARYKGDEIADLKKAVWYLNRKLELLEKTS